MLIRKKGLGKLALCLMLSLILGLSGLVMPAAAYAVDEIPVAALSEIEDVLDYQLLADPVINADINESMDQPVDPSLSDEGDGSLASDDVVDGKDPKVEDNTVSSYDIAPEPKTVSGAGDSEELVETTGDSDASGALEAEPQTGASDVSITTNNGFEEDAELISTNSHDLIMPAAAGYEVKIIGDGVENPITLTKDDLEQMEQVFSTYSSINTWPTKKWYTAEGVKLADLLDMAVIKPEAKLITVKSTDGYKMTFTRKELLTDHRYYYPGLKENAPYDGSIPGSPDSAVKVDTILALQSIDSENPEYMSDQVAPLLVFGQRWVTEQTNHAFAKYVGTIEVSTATPEKWANPTATPASGTVAAGTGVKLSSPNNDADKVHYTTDGSNPTYKSPMYNWIASRWWSSREDVLDEINHPIEMNEDTTIKAVVIGIGKEDSDIVSFDYQVPVPDPAPVLTADSTDNEVGQAVDITFIADAAWENAITEITVNGNALTSNQYSVSAGNLNIAASVFNVAGDYAIVVKATGYEDATVIQTVNEESPIGDAEILLSSNSGIPGVTIFITGSGFDADTAGTIWFDTNNNGVWDEGEPSVAVNTDENGAIPLLTSLTVPSESAGSYTVQADIGDIEANASFTISDSGIIVDPTNGNSRVGARYITINGSGFLPNTSYRLFIDRNGNGVFDETMFKEGTTTASGTLSVTNMTWPSAPTGIYNVLLDIGKNGTIDASASIVITPSIYFSSPRGNPGNNIGMNIDGFQANATGYVWFDTNGNGVWDEGENQAPVTTGNAGTAISPGLYVPSVMPGPYQVCADIPACGLKASATYTVRGVALNTSSGTAGTSLDIVGYGYMPNKTSGYYIWFDTNGNGIWDADETEVEVTTDANGDLHPVSLIVPAVPAGDYNVCASFLSPVNFAVFTVNDTPSEPVTYPVTFAVTPEDATVVVKDSEGIEVTAEADGTYKLEAGEYSYTVSSEGYVEQTGNFTVTGEPQTVTVVLEEETVQPETPQYKITPEPDAIYEIGVNEDGIKTMTVNADQIGFKYFTVSIEPVIANEGTETAVFTHRRNDTQLELNAVVADFDVADTAKAGFNVQPGDVIRAYIVDSLTNETGYNPTVFNY
ncbi:hemoblobin-interacting domain-containing protein [Syntrophomonas erecta]